MKLNRTALMGCAAALALTTGQALAGSVVFSDNFDAEAPGLGWSNGNLPLTNWKVTDGSIDVFGVGNQDFYAGNGRYVDLDGTSFNAATISLKNLLNLTAGQYELSFDLAGAFSPYDAGKNANFVDVSFGSVTENHTAAWQADFTTRSILLTLATDALVDIVFNHAGNDNNGVILDNVVVTRLGDVAAQQSPVTHMPTPAAAGAGLMLMGLLGLKRRSKA